ncbi:MAG TPA: ATP-binding protein [Jatrophihabitantaceae bacterium]|nr:ATP-binding protein [Jatrophihabitantaceae bacterium]
MSSTLSPVTSAEPESAADVSSDTAHTRPGSLFAGRYEVRRSLKSGNGVDTVIARDVTNDAHVVLKVIDPEFVHPAARLRFQHETQVLRELGGLGICALYDAGHHDDRLYLAQPLVLGETLEDALRRGPLVLRDALRVGIDVAAALDVAHGAGVCHRDVKPANIIVDSVNPVSEVTLVDFGFARSPWLDASIRDELVGTVRYLAPESAGSLASPADERSDLYALGVVLFECLAGQPPYPGATVSELLRQHLSMPVPDLRSMGVAVPRAVDDILQRLLRKDPAERYQSASALDADLSGLLRALDAGDPDPRVVVGRFDQRQSLTDPSFVGRDAELEILNNHVNSLTTGGSGIVLLEADSGGGKSRLLGETARQAAEAGVTVLHGQGVANAGQRPFTMLLGVIDELMGMLDEDAVARAAVVEQLRDVAPALVRAIPSLTALLGSAGPYDTGPEQFGELRSITGLRRLLRSVASAERPVLLVLDDCQWADTLTIRLLNELYPSSDPPAHLGVIAAFRSEEVAPDHMLRGLDAARTVALGPLSPRSMAMLAESMAGQLPAMITEAVVRLADGNPFMGAAVLRGMLETSALVPGPDGWSVSEAGLLDVQAARRSAAFLVRRLELLSPDALRMLSVGAVLGKQFDIVTAVAIAGTSDEAAAIFSDARRRRLVWVDERTGRCNFFHDKIREALLDRLTDEERRELHSRSADFLVARHEATGGDIVFDLAYHLDAAGRHVEALPHALASATMSRARYALDAAAAHYRMAARGCRDDDIATRVAVAEGLGDVLTLQGVYGDAKTYLVQARALVTEPARAAELDGKLGDLAFKQGDIPNGKRHLEGALAGLGRRIPRRGTLTIALLWELFVQAAHTIAPRLLTSRRTATGHETDFLAMHLYSRLAYLYWFHSGKVSCAWAHLRGLNLAERYPPSAELGQAYSEHAPVMTMLPWYRRGIRYADRSLAIRRDLGDVWGQGQSLAFTGVTEYAASHYEVSIAKCLQAIKLLRQTGDQWEMNTAAWNLALCHWRRGELAQAVGAAREVFQSAKAIGDQTAAGIGLSIWTRAAGGHVDARLIEEQLANGAEDAQTAAELHLALALHHRAQADLTAALTSIEAAITTVHDAGLRQEYIAPIFPWAATIRREIAESASVYDPRRRRRLLREAARETRRARRWAAFYRNNAPHALRESALLAAARGRHRRADRLLANSIAVADVQGAAYEAALSHAAHASLQLARGVAETAVDLAREEQAAADLHLIESTTPGVVGGAGDVPTLSIFDRFAMLLHVGRAITAATSYPALEAAIREAALSLLRAERCHLVPVAALAQERLTTQSGEDLYDTSRTLLTRAVDEGGPVIALEHAADSNESLLLSGIRSAIAAPIMVGGEPTTCLYATHRQVGQLFGEEEIQLAAFIATLAGAALEHIAGSEARFRSLAQNSSDVITLVDGNGVVSYQSSAVKRVFATAAKTMLGRTITDWVHPDDLDVFTQALASAGKTDDTRVECRLRHADGSYLVTETAVTNLLAEPTVAALVLNTRDVTDRKRAEEQLREKNLELEKAGRAKDMFLASMSHELRTPLNAIIGFTGTLLMELPGPLNTEQSRQLRTVQHSGQHLLAIINDLLDLAKIESGAVELALEEVDCVQVTQSVVTSLQPLADAKSLPLTAAMPGVALMARSDARALGQILINLVNNAIKFTDTGEVSVTVDCAPDGRPRIVVSDTGPGIDVGDLGRIFNAFERGLVNTARRPEGTGLGLHICQKLAELIDAEITVASSLGGGSRFAVILAKAA